MFEVCSVCQNDCEDCSNGGLIANDRKYHMSMHEVREFIRFTKLSNYFIQTLYINGAGEPTLWKHFDEGINLLYTSGIIGRIYITSNGLSLDRISEGTWPSIYSMHVSQYPHSAYETELGRLKSRYGFKIHLTPTNEFRERPTRRYPNTIPCLCGCYGPMVVYGKVFLYCGPPVFDAAKIMNVDIWKRHDLYSDLGHRYLERYDEKKIGNLDLCEYCWANQSIAMSVKPHQAHCLPR
jgi:hypothetical protein